MSDHHGKADHVDQGFFLRGHLFAEFMGEVVTAVVAVADAVRGYAGGPEPEALTAAGRQLLRVLAENRQFDVADLWTLYIYFRVPFPETLYPVLPVLGRLTESAAAFACAAAGSEKRAWLVGHLAELVAEFDALALAAVG